MRGTALVEALEMFERIADGLAMPDRARIALGLAPRARPSGGDIPSRDTGSVLAAADSSGRLSAHSAESEEDESPVHGELLSA